MPYVKWMMGVVDLTKEEEMPIGRNVLEVTNIRQSANYTCVAISSLGMIETTAQITVKGERAGRSVREGVWEFECLFCLVFGILLGSPVAVAKVGAALPGVHTKHET